MRIKMLDSETGRLGDGLPVRHWRAGQEYEIPNRIAERWIAIGLAVAVNNTDTPATDPTSPDFASDEAAEAWIEAGQPDLSDMDPSGKTGYTTKDVRAASPTEDDTEDVNDGD